MLQWKQNSQGKSALITTKSIVNYKLLFPGGPIPHNMAKTFDGPPTLERSGSEHREGGVTSLALLERARAWEWVKDPPAGEGQVGHPQHCRAVTSFLLRFLSPTRGTEGVVKTIEKAWLEVELPLAKGRRRDSKDSFFNGKEPYIQGNISGKRKKQLYHSFNY